MEKSSDGKQLQFWLGILVSVGCLAAIFLLIDPAEIAAALKTAHYQYVALGVVGIFLFLILRAVRWRFMLENQISWSRVFHIQNIGYMLNKLLPFRIGEVGRAVLIGNVPPISLPQGLSTIVVERLLDMLFIVTLLPFTLAAVKTLPEAVRTAAIITGFLALVAILILIIAANQRVRAGRLAAFFLDRIPWLDTKTWVTRADELLSGLSSLTRVRDGVILLVLSVLIWLPVLFSYYMILEAVGIDPSLAMSGFVVCAAALSISAPSSPGQVGVYHAGVTFALVQILNQPQAASASFAFIYHALDFLIMIGVGLIGIYRLDDYTMGSVIASARALMTRQKKTVGS